MLHNPYKIVQMFEEEVAHYTGAPYAVSVDSCTNALFLCLKMLNFSNGKNEITIPSKTYLSVPMSIIHAGFIPVFDESLNDWVGEYPLSPLPVWDSAKRLTSGMYRTGQYQCLSFHAKKRLPIGKGGMILTENKAAVEWLKRARYEGRSEKFYKEDQISELGYNMYMSPEQAAKGLVLMQQLPEGNPDVDEVNGYRDLRQFEVFKKYVEKPRIRPDETMFSTKNI